MKQSLHIGKEPSLQHIVIASAVFHLVLILLITLPLKTKEPEYKSYLVNLVPSPEVRREVKASAKKETSVPEVKAAKKAAKPAAKEKANVKPPLEKRAKPAPKADMSLENTKKVSKEIERLEAIQAFSKKKEQRDKGKETDEEIAQAIEVIRKKSHGSAQKSGGIPGAQTSMDSDSYYALVTRKIWSEWIYPDLGASGLEVIISIKIGKDGMVISQEIEKSSGNIIFDRSAAKAVSKASPLPPPAAELEIGVRFYL